ncbi:hypothetical protein RJ640_019867 [Escallonia rubra]|uniref:Uncharacterized protein n=1 Tax=Escallonia rubra TaxID=112253 RepID=A0AA88UVD8_9ASTE|nr:hypothetical protein RJ640_019867 [Escallonia rubra]
MLSIICCSISYPPLVHNKGYPAVFRLSHSCGFSLRTAISASVVSPITVENPSDKDSFAASYLINSCGLSPETAISASQKVHFKTLDQPNSVLALFTSHGFTKTQIAKLIRKRPVFLLSDPQKTLLPKLQFFQSIGVSNADLARTLAKDPTILTRSLEKQIIPTYNFLKSVLQSDEKVVGSMKRTTWIFLEDYNKNLAPNIAFLRDIGVPESCIKLLLTHFPEAIMQKPDQFCETVNQIKEMGFDPSKSMFVLGVHALSGKGNRSIWDRCYVEYGKWGWSKDDILLAFTKHPNCMILSEKKISRAMDFLVNKMGWESRMISRCPGVLFFSLEKRIIPRCSVVHVLLLKGLLKGNVSLSTVLVPVEKYFLEKFVTKYEEEVPQLFSVYKGKVDALEI